MEQNIKGLSLLVAGFIVLTAVGVGCSSKSPATTSNASYAAGMLNLVPAQNGKALPLSFSIPGSGDGITCQVPFSRLSPGDSGSITWTMLNIYPEDGEFSSKASLIPASVVPASEGSAGDYIGVKLKDWSGYLVGNDSNYAPLADVVKMLNSQLRNLFAGDTITFELDWQVMGGASGSSTGQTKSKTDYGTLSVTFTLVQLQAIK